MGYMLQRGRVITEYLPNELLTCCSRVASQIKTRARAMSPCRALPAAPGTPARRPGWAHGTPTARRREAQAHVTHGKASSGRQSQGGLCGYPCSWLLWAPQTPEKHHRCRCRLKCGQLAGCGTVRLAPVWLLDLVLWLSVTA